MSYFSKKRTLFAIMPRTKRSHYMVLLLVCVVSLFVAWYFQNVMGYAPCPLCVVQRYAFWLLGFISLVGLFCGYLSRWLTWFSVAIGVLGVGVAIHHNWVVAHPSSKCTPDQLEQFVNGLPIAIWWPDLFFATGSCSAKLPPFVGLTMPQWSLVVLFGLTLAFLLHGIRFKDKE